MTIQAYLAIKYHANHSNRERIAGVSAALHAHDITTYCVTRDLEQWGTVHFDSQTLMQKSFAAIDASDFVVVDLTEKGVGLGIEAGYAYAKHISIITIAQTGSDISETLRGIAAKVWIYQDYKELQTRFASLLIANATNISSPTSDDNLTQSRQDAETQSFYF